jgi:hypothetical protein
MIESMEGFYGYCMEGTPPEPLTPVLKTVVLTLTHQKAELFADHVVPRWTGTNPSNLDALLILSAVLPVKRTRIVLTTNSSMNST